ncbi:MAG TPA: DUF3352 domain-containing protein [Solirubrobacterales bacterium]|nr:DUF3352 domain-containing protein [Solirubrobacterales bacterium]
MRGRGLQEKGAFRAALIALLAGVLSLLAGCGDDEPTSDLAELAPPDAPLYAEAVLRPDSEQAGAIESVASEAAGIQDPGALLIEELDGSLAAEDISYAEDIEPWLGEHGAFFIRSFEANGEREFPDFAALLEIDDVEGAEDFITQLAEAEPDGVEELSYGDFDYFYSPDDGGYAVGIVEEALVISTEASFKLAVDAAEGESLAESAEFSERTEALGDGRLATFFLEPGSAVEAAIGSGELSREDARTLRPLLAGVGSGPLAGGLEIEETSAAIELAAAVEDEDAVAPDAELLGELPAGAGFALALPHLGQTLEFAIDRLQTSGLPGARSLQDTIEERAGIDLGADVASWLGDVSAFLSGSTPADLRVGVVAETSDPEGPGELLDAVSGLIRREEPRVPIGPPPEGSEEGFTIGIPGFGPQAAAGVIGDEFVGAFGLAPSEVLDPPDRLEDDELFEEATDALGDDFDPLLFIDLPAVLPILRAGGADEGRDYAEAEPYFNAFRFLIAGAQVEDQLATVRFTVAVP